MSIQPPMIEGRGRAPSGVCSRWTGDSPCGAAATHHVIWDSEMTNGAVCAAHTEEIRQNWVYLGLHPYTEACAAAGIAVWLAGEDRCVLPEDWVPEMISSGRAALSSAGVPLVAE